MVRAEGTPNPYRLKPLVGVRLPVNSSYSPLIQMHNPHSEPIQVRRDRWSETLWSETTNLAHLF